MRVGIWHRSTAKMDGERVRTQATGGTESAVVHTAEALAGLGPQVDVWANCDADLYFEGVRYRPNRDAARQLAGERYDAFIIVRHLAGATLPIEARLVTLWTHDSLDQPFPHGLVRWRQDGVGEPRCALHTGDAVALGLVDLIFAVSYWQARGQEAHFGVPHERVHVIGNGLSREAQKTLGVREHKRPFVLHTLPPDRALARLIEIFPRVRERVPKAELHAYSRSTIYGVGDAEDRATNGHLYEALKRVDGAKHFDPIEPRSLYAALRRAKVWLYPTTVHETFSISALEAQAAGCVPVASATGALTERIEHGVDGFLVPGDPREETVRAEFVEYVVRLLEDDALRESMSAAGRERALGPRAGYGAVAARMLSTFEQALEGRDFTPRGLDLDALSWPLAVHTLSGASESGVDRATFESLLAETRTGLAIDA